MGKSGREIWISVFDMIISCLELVKIKRGNKIKEVRSGVVGTAGVRDGEHSGGWGTPTWMVGVCSGTDIITTDRFGALSRADGHGRGHDGDAQREIWGEQREICGAQRSVGHGRREGWCAQRDGYEGGCGVGELRLCGTPY